MANWRTSKMNTNKVKLVFDRRSCAKAKRLLGRLKSYEDWVSTASSEILQWAEREYGSPSQFYDKFKGFREAELRVARRGSC
jgi:hypothetical protein